MRLQQLIILFVGLLLNMTVWAQHSPDFAEKFMTLCQGDTNVTCVTVSPKMMEQQMMTNAINGMMAAEKLLGNKAPELLSRIACGIQVRRSTTTKTTIPF